LRAIVGEILASNGYSVVTAADPLEAEEAVRAHGGPIHCLLTNVVCGQELTNRLMAERPGLKAVFMSGTLTKQSGSPCRRKALEAQGVLRDAPSTRASCAWMAGPT